MFANMLSRIEQVPDSSGPMTKTKRNRHKQPKAVITYPGFNLKDRPNNPCLIPMPFNHLLTCGHIISTAKEGEPCGLNCAHIAASKKLLLQTKDEGFICEACIEEEFEKGTKAGYSGEDVENLRKSRSVDANARQLRQCFIHASNSSIPWNNQGDFLGEYTPEPGHPLDKSTPSTSKAFFRGIDERIPGNIPVVFPKEANGANAIRKMPNKLSLSRDTHNVSEDNLVSGSAANTRDSLLMKDQEKFGKTEGSVSAKTGDILQPRKRPRTVYEASNSTRDLISRVEQSNPRSEMEKTGRKTKRRRSRCPSPSGSSESDKN